MRYGTMGILAHRYVANSIRQHGIRSPRTPAITYSSAYGSVPLQGTTSGVATTWPLPSLGIDEQAVNDASGKQIAITRVHPGSPAERAGLQVGDTIISANGYLTQDPGNLAWIINHHVTERNAHPKCPESCDRQNATVTVTLH